MSKNISRFLIMGGGGYLGSVMVPMLLEKKYRATVIDRFFWGKKVLKPNKNLLLIEVDARSFPEKHLKGIDVVIDLAALSNDPIAELDPQKTYDINYKARLRTAGLAKKHGVKKYILASSCSVYGFRDEILRETSKPSPVTTYAKTSLLAEQGVLSLASKDFSVTSLRLGTLHGVSPRMRFDLVLNTMVLSLFQNNTIIVQGGEQWRPILHVKDAAKAFIKVAESKSKKVNGHVFNVGSDKHNYQMKVLAKVVSSIKNPRGKIMTQKLQSDFRSYRVSFTKIQNTLNYKTENSPKDSAKEIFDALQSHRIQDDITTRTIDWYKYLLSKNPQLL